MFLVTLHFCRSKQAGDQLHSQDLEAWESPGIASVSPGKSGTVDLGVAPASQSWCRWASSQKEGTPRRGICTTAWLQEKEGQVELQWPLIESFLSRSFLR